MATSPDERSLGQLFNELTTQLTTLVRQETEFARTEIGASVRAAGRQAALAGLGALLIHAALLVLLAAVVLGRIEVGVRPWLAAVLVALAVGTSGGALVQLGRSRLGRFDLAPRRTVGTLKEDAAWTKEQLP